jgi:hypothetical protein
VSYKEMVELSEKDLHSNPSRTASQRTLEKATPTNDDMLDTLFAGVTIPTAKFVEEIDPVVEEAESIPFASIPIEKEDYPVALDDPGMNQSQNLAGYVPLPAIEGEDSRPSSNESADSIHEDTLTRSKTQTPASSGDNVSVSLTLPSSEITTSSNSDPSELEIMEADKLSTVPLQSIPSSRETSSNSAEGDKLEKDDYREETDKRLRATVAGIIAKNPEESKSGEMTPERRNSERRSSIISSFSEEDKETTSPSPSIRRASIIEAALESEELPDNDESRDSTSPLGKPDSPTHLKKFSGKKRGSVLGPRGRKPSVIASEDESSMHKSFTPIKSSPPKVDGVSESEDLAEDTFSEKGGKEIIKPKSKGNRKRSNSNPKRRKPSIMIANIEPMNRSEEISETPDCISESVESNAPGYFELTNDNNALPIVEEVAKESPRIDAGSSTSTLDSLDEKGKAVPVNEEPVVLDGDIKSKRVFDTEPDQLEMNYQRIHTGEFYSPENIPKFAPKMVFFIKSNAKIPDGVKFFNHVHDMEKRRKLIEVKELARHPTFNDQVSMDAYLEAGAGDSKIPFIEQISNLTTELDQLSVPVPSLLRKRAVLYCRAEKYENGLIDFEKSLRYGKHDTILIYSRPIQL